MANHNEGTKGGGWKSVPAFGDWEKAGVGIPDYSMDFSKIRKHRKFHEYGSLALALATRKTSSILPLLQTTRLVAVTDATVMTFTQALLLLQLLLKMAASGITTTSLMMMVISTATMTIPQLHGRGS